MARDLKKHNTRYRKAPCPSGPGHEAHRVECASLYQQSLSTNIRREAMNLRDKKRGSRPYKLRHPLALQHSCRNLYASVAFPILLPIILPPSTSPSPIISTT